MLILCATLLYVNHYSFLNVQSSFESSAIVLTCSLMCPLTLHSHQILDRETKVLFHKAIVNQKKIKESQRKDKKSKASQIHILVPGCAVEMLVFYIMTSFMA